MTWRMVITDRHKHVFNGFDMDECYDPRERLYEMMNQFEDQFGDTQDSVSIGNPPDRYGAPRFLPRGKRITGS